MDPPERSFLRAIAERPDDDEPRLVYADWLEDRGDLRAELIRVQCRRAQSRSPPADLLIREVVLLRDHAAHWLNPLRELGIRGAKFVRGLMEDVEVTQDEWLANSHEIQERLPTITTFRLRDGTRDPCLRDSLARATWPTLRELDLRGCKIDRTAVQDLVKWPGISRITTLGLAQTHLSLEGLLCMQSLTHLETLDLTGNHLGDDAIGVLTARPRCTNVRDLRLDENRLTDRGLSQLMMSPAWFPLRTLSVASNEIRLGPVWSASTSMPMPHLRAADLSGNPLAHGGDVRLSDCSGFLRLKSLDLSGCGLRSPDIRSILSLRVLSRLALDGNPLEDDGIVPLAESRNFRLLRHLSLARTRLGDIAANALAASTSLADLQSLNVEDNRLGEPASRVLRNRFGARVRL